MNVYNLSIKRSATSAEKCSIISVSLDIMLDNIFNSYCILKCIATTYFQKSASFSFRFDLCASFCTYIRMLILILLKLCQIVNERDLRLNSLDGSTAPVIANATMPQCMHGAIICLLTMGHSQGHYYITCCIECPWVTAYCARFIRRAKQSARLVTNGTHYQVSYELGSSRFGKFIG